MQRGDNFLQFAFFTFYLIRSKLVCRLSACLRKVIRHRKEERKKEDRKKEKKAMNLVATTFASKTVYNATRAAHALRSDQYSTMKPTWYSCLYSIQPNLPGTMGPNHSIREGHEMFSCSKSVLNL